MSKLVDFSPLKRIKDRVSQFNLTDEAIEVFTAMGVRAIDYIIAVVDSIIALLSAELAKSVLIQHNNRINPTVQAKVKQGEKLLKKVGQYRTEIWPTIINTLSGKSGDLVKNNQTQKVSAGAAAVVLPIFQDIMKDVFAQYDSLTATLRQLVYAAAKANSYSTYQNYVVANLRTKLLKFIDFKDYLNQLKARVQTNYKA